MVIRGAPGDIGVFLRAAAVQRSLGCQHTRLRCAYIGTAVYQRSEVGILCRRQSEVRPVGPRPQRFRWRGQAGKLPQGQCSALAVEFGQLHIRTGALGFDFRAGGVLRGQVPGIDPFLRAYGKLGGTAFDQID